MREIEKLRGEYVRSLFELKTFSDDWDARRAAFLHALGDQRSISAANVLAVGDSLGSIFRLDISGRSQEDLSSGGNVWRALVGYYLNMCLCGTGAIAVHRTSMIPKSLVDAVKVTYQGGTPLNSDLDLVVFYHTGLDSLGARARVGPRENVARFIDDEFESTSMIVVQTKTNWNDNAQTPMLWNMIFSLAANNIVPRDGYHIGSGARKLHNLRSFSYSFVTVPTNKLENFKPASMPVVRVRPMTGGAFWGYPTRQGVCNSLQEFFGRNHSVAQANFPDPSVIGRAFARAASAGSSNEIDLAAFRLFPEINLPTTGNLSLELS